ncbi:MAG TPA: putative quinol monooxygenase [Plantibacter sp.]|uniref:putative quinol monooxygenase n=1 Tax=unclassified Plantibacter TaxID=2624265 RepID=UPI002BFD68D1|nr:putative quinol monooxygenase [Plantibacter sp.]
MTIDIPPRDGVIALVGTAKPLPHRAAELRALLTSFVEPTRAEPGALAYDLHEDDAGDLVFTERWRSEADLRAHLALPHMVAFQTSRMEYLAEDLRISWLTPIEP